jgi:hypothetical protein
MDQAQRPELTDMQVLDFGLYWCGFTRAIPFGQGRYCGAQGPCCIDARHVVQAGFMGLCLGFDNRMLFKKISCEYRPVGWGTPFSTAILEISERRKFGLKCRNGCLNCRLRD